MGPNQTSSLCALALTLPPPTLGATARIFHFFSFSPAYVLFHFLQAKDLSFHSKVGSTTVLVYFTFFLISLTSLMFFPGQYNIELNDTKIYIRAEVWELLSGYMLIAIQAASKNLYTLRQFCNGFYCTGGNIYSKCINIDLLWTMKICPEGVMKVHFRAVSNH